MFFPDIVAPRRGPPRSCFFPPYRSAAQRSKHLSSGPGEPGHGGFWPSIWLWNGFSHGCFSVGSKYIMELLWNGFSVLEYFSVLVK